MLFWFWGTLWPMNQADRIEWILANRGMSQRSLSVAAGLSPSAVAVILRRLRTSKRGDPNAGSVAALVAIARAGQVDLVWFLTDEGTPEGQPSARTTPGLAMAYMKSRDKTPAQAVTIAERIAALIPGDLDEKTWDAILADLSHVSGSARKLKFGA